MSFLYYFGQRYEWIFRGRLVTGWKMRSGWVRLSNLSQRQRVVVPLVKVMRWWITITTDSLKYVEMVHHHFEINSGNIQTTQIEVIQWTSRFNNSPRSIVFRSQHATASILFICPKKKKRWFQSSLCCKTTARCTFMIAASKTPKNMHFHSRSTSGKQWLFNYCCWKEDDSRNCPFRSVSRAVSNIAIRFTIWEGE